MISETFIFHQISVTIKTISCRTTIISNSSINWILPLLVRRLPLFSTISTHLRENSGGLGGFTGSISGNQMGTTNSCPRTCLSGSGFSGFQGFVEKPGNSMFLTGSKLLRPLDSFPSVGAQPTLFQKRAALRKNLADNGGNFGNALSGTEGDKGKKEMNKENEKKKICNRDNLDDVSIDGSALNYDSDEFTENNKVEETLKNGGSSLNANSTVTGGDQKDRASILGDAIEYRKELLQRINDLHNELESNPGSSSLTPTASFHLLMPTPATLPSRTKDELCPGSLLSPNGQPATVEVRLREGKAVNIHMFCGSGPGLLLSTMRALDSLGLDIQQAVISCFNGFAMDIFRAEQCKEGQDIHPEQIKAVLLDSAGFNNMI